jgi:hypothetical protein
MNRRISNIIFIVAGIAFYVLWNYGGDRLYGKFVSVGIEHFVTNISDLEKVSLNYVQEKHQLYIACKFPKIEVGVSMVSYLPVVLLLAWQFSLFFDKRITTKKAFRLFAINFLVFYLLQITYPILLRSKSSIMFIGVQIFSFLVFFFILKDSLVIKSLEKQQKIFDSKDLS